MKKLFIAALVIAFALSGSAVFAGDFSDAALKKVEELKLLSRDKKDIPESFGGVKLITATDLKKMIDEKKQFVLLDNRIPADYEKERIAGAKRLSPDDLLEKGLKAADAVGLKKTDTIVFY